MKNSILSTLTLLLTLALSSCAPVRAPDTGLQDDSAALASTVKIYNDLTLTFHGEVLQRGVSGSGAVIAQEASGYGIRTLVLTAAHVCRGPEVPPELAAAGATITAKLKIERLDGAKYPARVLHIAADHDLCFLGVDALVARPLVLAAINPPIGAHVISVGSPRGLWWSGTAPVAFITDLRYAGISLTDFPEPLMAFSGVATGGNSGGPILYRGQLVSVLVATATSGGVLVLGVPVYFVRAELDAALKAWRK